MSVQYETIRAEMEGNPTLQKVIVVHHILQVVGLVLTVIILGAASQFDFISLILMVLLSAIIPTILFIIFWIASKCNYRDLRSILVHFNPILSMLWFIAIFPFFIVCASGLGIGGGLYILVSIITFLMSLSSAIFAVYGIWKSARNVILSARSDEREHFDGPRRFHSSYETPGTFTDCNGISLPQANFDQPMLTP